MAKIRYKDDKMTYLASDTDKLRSRPLEQIQPDLTYEELDEKERRKMDTLFPRMALVIINGIDTGYLVDINGNVYNDTTGLQIKSHPDKNGYLLIGLHFKGYPLGYATRVHRLVARAFVPNPDPEHKTQVNHINSNRQDNWYGNLEWCTPLENMRHAHLYGGFKDNGGLTYGEINGQAKYTNDDIHAVCKMLEDGKDSKTIAKITGIDINTISRVRRGADWKFISSKYDMKHAFVSHKHLSEYDIHYICKLLSEGKSVVDIQKERPDISVASIRGILNGTRHAKISSTYPKLNNMRYDIKKVSVEN